MGDVTDQLDRARVAVDRRAWEDAHARLAALDGREALDAVDLDRLALSAHLTGRHAAAEDAWSRAHHAFHQRGDVHRAVRCAFWLGLVLLTSRGDEGRGGGWIARAQRLLEDADPGDCAEQGYLLLPAALHELDAGDPALA